MKLEEGMYIRNEDGYILNLTKENIYGYKSLIGSSNIKIKSHNIIDLIEEGDILEINNEKYEVIYDESYEKLGILIPDRKQLAIRHSALYYVFKEYKVSIVTKEQFDSMKYEVDSNE